MTGWHGRGVTRWWHEVTESYQVKTEVSDGVWLTRHHRGVSLFFFVHLFYCHPSCILSTLQCTSSHTFGLFLPDFDSECEHTLFCLTVCAHITNTVKCLSCCSVCKFVLELFRKHEIPCIFTLISHIIGHIFALVRVCNLHFVAVPEYFYFILRCVYVCAKVWLWVLLQITFFLFALLALSQSHDVLNGRFPYFCWQMKRTRGRKLKVLPLFHTPAATHTDSAANLGKYQCESRAYKCLHGAMHCSLYSENSFAFFQNVFESICHICTVFLVEQCILTVLRKYDSTGHGPRVWPVWPNTHPTSCSVQFDLPREVGRHNSYTHWQGYGNKYSTVVLESDALHLLIHCLWDSVF